MYHLFGICFALITGLCYPLFIFLSKPIITCIWPLACVKFVPWYQAWNKCIRGRWIGTSSCSGTPVWCWWDERCGAVKHFSAPLIYHCHEGRGKRLSSAEARESHGSCWLIAFFSVWCFFFSASGKTLFSPLTNTAEVFVGVKTSPCRKRPLGLFHSVYYSLSFHRLNLKSSVGCLTYRILLFLT